MTEDEPSNVLLPLHEHVCQLIIYESLYRKSLKDAKDAKAAKAAKDAKDAKAAKAARTCVVIHHLYDACKMALKAFIPSVPQCTNIINAYADSDVSTVSEKLLEHQYGLDFVALMKTRCDKNIAEGYKVIYPEAGAGKGSAKRL